MTIDAELEAHILRLYHVEKWRCGTIARQLHVHRDTVKRVLAQAGLPHHGPAPRSSMIEPYLPFIGHTPARKGHPLRRHEGRRARTPGRGHPFPSDAARLRRALSVRAPDRWPLRAATRRGELSVRFVMSATRF